MEGLFRFLRDTTSIEQIIQVPAYGGLQETHRLRTAERSLNIARGFEVDQTVENRLRDCDVSIASWHVLPCV
jgi:hypothetical protein